MKEDLLSLEIRATLKALLREDINVNKALEQILHIVGTRSVRHETTGYGCTKVDVN